MWQTRGRIPRSLAQSKLVDTARRVNSEGHRDTNDTVRQHHRRNPDSRSWRMTINGSWRKLRSHDIAPVARGRMVAWRVVARARGYRCGCGTRGMAFGRAQQWAPGTHALVETALRLVAATWSDVRPRRLNDSIIRCWWARCQPVLSLIARLPDYLSEEREPLASYSRGERASPARKRAPRGDLKDGRYLSLSPSLRCAPNFRLSQDYSRARERGLGESPHDR